MYVKPTFKDILKAKNRIAPYLIKTPLLEYPLLSEALGFQAYVKHENYQPTGAFKIRGGINLISQLSSEEKRRGVITASTGNHGQSIALASKMFGVDATVCVQEGANPVKVGGIRSYGAKIIEKGKDFDEARENAESLSKEKGYRYVHSANEPLLISGVGTVGLEIIEELPDLDVVIVPVGGGSQASGICTCFKTVAPDVEIIAVQSTHAPSVYNSWKSGKFESTKSANTMADGLATRIPFELPLKIMWEMLDDFVLVTDEEIESAIKMYVEKAHTIAEGAGAASLAAAIKISERLQDKKVVLILSGGNLPADILRNILWEGTDLLEDFIAQGAKELRLRDKTLDNVLDMARKARILSKQAIHKIHMGDPSDSQQKLENAADLISKMDQFLKTYPELTRFDQVSASKEEFSEASILLSLYTDDKFPNPEVLGVPITSYLMGLGDVPGELRRQALEALRIGDIDLAEARLEKMEEIYLSLMTMEEGPLLKGYRRKLDIARGSIERTRSEVTAEVGRKRLEESVNNLSKKLE